MENSKSEYYLGICKGCGKTTALKDGYCAKCKDNLPDVFRDLFKGIIKESPDGL
jgi:predicted amidophosphoribosyltransferase